MNNLNDGISAVPLVAGISVLIQTAPNSAYIDIE